MGRAQQRKKKGKERLDRYYHLAKEQGYRARSAFKLIQLAQKYDLFTNCRVAVDLCAAPGGWMQVCARHMPLSSVIIGVDLAPIQPIKGCTAFQGDITSQECKTRLKKILSGQEADMFLHDGSPNMGMDWNIDAFNQNVLVLHAVHIACDFLKRGGTFVSKVFRSSDYASLLYVLQQLFAKVEATKPQASRNVSAEIFVICKGYKKPDKVDLRLFDPKFAFLAADDEAEYDALNSGHMIPQDTPEFGNTIVPQKTTRVKFAEAFADSQKRRRGGYTQNEIRYKILTLTEFFTTSSPVEALLSASVIKEISHKEKEPSNIAKTVLSHPLTTPEIKGLWEDIKVLGKRELTQLLKWRFKIIKQISLQHTHTHPTTNFHSIPTPQELTDEDNTETNINEELAALYNATTRQTSRQQRKAAKKQKLLETKQQFSRNAFAVTDPDPDLFTCNKATLTALAREEQMVDAKLILTEGEGPDNEISDLPLPYSESVVLPEGISLEKELKTKVVKDDDSDLDAIDRMEIDLEVGLRLRALQQAERGKTKALHKVTRRAKVLAERTEEVRAVTADLQARALEHLSKVRKVEEEDEDDSDKDYNDEILHSNQSQALVHEYFDQEPQAVVLVESREANSKPKTNGNDGCHNINNSSKTVSSSFKAREAQATARWFSQPLFSSAVEEVADTLLAEEFDPVVQQQQQLQQQQQQQLQQQGQKNNTEDVLMKELDDSQLPQIPLSEKQKKQQQRKKEQLKKAAKVAKSGYIGIDDEICMENNDTPQRIEEVPQDVITPPQTPEEVAEFQAIGAMLIRRVSRMDLIDGAYNRYAFNDDYLPEWFVEDEEKHNKPELPVTKELMREYRQKMKEINSRPIRKVQEAKVRKKKRVLRVLEKVKRQAQGIADSSELSEFGKTKAIARLSKKVLQGSEKKGKTVIISRRVGGGKVSQKSQGKAIYGRGVKLVDRRLKKDKRAMQKLQRRKGNKHIRKRSPSTTHYT